MSPVELLCGIINHYLVLHGNILCGNSPCNRKPSLVRSLIPVRYGKKKCLYHLGFNSKSIDQNYLNLSYLESVDLNEEFFVHLSPIKGNLSIDIDCTKKSISTFDLCLVYFSPPKRVTCPTIKNLTIHN